MSWLSGFVEDVEAVVDDPDWLADEAALICIKTIAIALDIWDEADTSSDDEDELATVLSPLPPSPRDPSAEACCF